MVKDPGAPTLLRSRSRKKNRRVLIRPSLIPTPSNDVAGKTIFSCAFLLECSHHPGNRCHRAHACKHRARLPGALALLFSCVKGVLHPSDAGGQQHSRAKGRPTITSALIPVHPASRTPSPLKTHSAAGLPPASHPSALSSIGASSAQCPRLMEWMTVARGRRTTSGVEGVVGEV
ncbi:hypothetical protein DUNSADRAFT_16156, partial [Dunaliella salina]